MTSDVNASCLKLNSGRLFDRYKGEILVFFTVFMIVFSSLKMHSAAASSGNVEQWINLTNEMFYGEQDFIFSYGPLYWLTGGASTQYSVLTYWASMVFISFVSACFWSILFTLVNRARTYILFAAAFFLFFGVVDFSAAFYLLPFAIVAYLEFLRGERLTISSLCLITLGLTVGFLFYVRFFYGLVGLATLGSYFFVRFFYERRILGVAVFFLGVVISYMLVGLAVFHDSVSFVDYLKVNKSLSFGNSVDMTYDIVNSTGTFIAVAFVVILINAYLLLRRRSLLLTVNILLLLFFKLGFSRTDHYVGYFVVPVAVLSLILIFEVGRLGRFLFVLVVASLFYISVTPSFPGAPTKNSFVAGIDFGSKYEDRMQGVYADFKLDDEIVTKIGRSSVDVYPYNNEYAFANKLNYKHRPLFQNYMTLTPELDSMNLRFFESPGRPKFIIWSSGMLCASEGCNIFEGFDGKYALNEDPLTSSAIFLNYHVVSLSKGRNGTPLILFEENEGYTLYSESVISEEVMAFDKWYKVPRIAAGVVKLAPDFRFTLYGRAKNLLFRGGVLKVRYKLSSGAIREYRLNIINSKNGVWVSPLLDEPGLSGDAVESVMFLSSSPNYIAPDFKSKWIVVGIQGVSARPVVSSDILGGVSGVEESVDTSCEGYIDTINGDPPASLKVDVHGILNVRGWLARSTQEGALYDQVFVTLTDSDGKVLFVPANIQNREDVGAVFKKPNLTKAGYSATVDLSAVNGVYGLGLGATQGSTFYSCRQFDIPIVVGKD